MICFDKKKFVTLYFIFAAITFSVSQVSYNTGAWVIATSQIRFHNKFSLHAEAQFRDHGIFNETEQILLRVGLNFHNSPQSMITVGYGRITNYPADHEFLETPSVTEDRVWEQYLMRNSVGRVIFEHRYRLEQRWIRINNSSRYLDRVRYCLRFTIPLNKKTLEKNTLFLSFYDELFINLTNIPFDRNRAYGVVGFQLTALANVQLGYMAQTIGTKTKSFLQAGLFYNIDLRKKE
ncbi:MAG: hypothetical protein K0S44_2295 [Bacteroidetes bacterium]|jgi:hypothetical protein|nr:hypothetical protein [Bacteroidota bacterium]